MQIQPREVNKVKLDFEFTIECMTLAYFAGKPWLSTYAYAWYAWMQYVFDKWIFSIGLPKLASLSAHGFILKFWVTNINQYEGRDDTKRHL
jgi:hypothetical protein